MIGEMFRVRIEKKLLKDATAVAEQIGTTPGEFVRLAFAQLVKRRAIPFPLNADGAEDEVLTTAKRRAKLWDEL